MLTFYYLDIIVNSVLGGGSFDCRVLHNRCSFKLICAVEKSKKQLTIINVINRII